MITTTFYRGQGLGNQLWAWASLYSLAQDNSYSYGIQAPWRFKGSSFLKIDFGERVWGLAPKAPSSIKPFGIEHYYVEKSETVKGIDISQPDEFLIRIPDKTKIDGVFQSEDYVYKYKKELSEMLKVKNIQSPDDDICVIHIRGGDYKGNSRLELGSNYYRAAIKQIKEIDNQVRIIVCSNDVLYASEILNDKNIEIVSDYLTSEVYSGPDGKVDGRVKRDFALLQNAKYVITANSSFSWWGAWTNQNSAMIIAPKYWANFNGTDPLWSTGGILTRNWLYLDVKGRLFSYEQCKKEMLNA